MHEYHSTPVYSAAQQICRSGMKPIYSFITGRRYCHMWFGKRVYTGVKYILVGTQHAEKHDENNQLSDVIMTFFLF